MVGRMCEGKGEVAFQRNRFRGSHRVAAQPWVLALLAVGALFFLGVVRILGRWWFIDDPGQFAAVRGFPNPVRFFVDLQYMRQFGSGRGVVPMQMLDYWIDVHLPFPEPLTGYVHNLLTALATLVVVFFVLRRVTRSDRLSFAGALVWMILPSTVATCIFISTRHYVEGLAFSGVVFLLASSSRSLGVAGWLALLLASVAAMLSKETYAGLVPAILLAFGLVRRDRPLIASAIVLAAAYAVYRIFSVGGGMKYVMPLLGPTGYLKYLVTTPYTFAATLLAYPIAVAAIVGTVRYVRGGGTRARRELVIFTWLMLVALFMLYPVAYAVVNSYRTPGPWYRSPFLPNTIVLVWLCLLCKRLGSAERSLRWIVLVPLSLLPGLSLFLRWWNRNMTTEETEARFCLDHPDRLLYSADPTYWYLGSVGDWYGARERMHVIHAEQRDAMKDAQELRRFGEVWTYHDGAVRRDPARTQVLKSSLSLP